MKKLTKRFSKNEGFTLMEIIIVIVILGILALIAVPRLIGFTTQAEKAADKEYAAVVARATELYWASELRNTVSGNGPYNVDITEIDKSNGIGLVDDYTNVLQYYTNEPTIEIADEVATVTISDGTDSVTYSSESGYTGP